MSRQKISEYLAKTTLYPAFNLDFLGYPATPTTTVQELKAHFGDQNLVIKVDQGIKKRGLQGLVKVNVTPSEIPSVISSWAKQGWTQFLAEPVTEHAPNVEHYLSLERSRTGWTINYSKRGGIDIESHWDEVSTDLPKHIKDVVYHKLIPLLDQYHFAFLEMNPILVRGSSLIPLDMAAEVDSAASPLATLPDRSLAPSEQAILTLDNSTPASLKFRLINPRGRIWMLLSGGGASLVLADEVADLGLGSELANYGEYSGAPTDDDVYSYTKIILEQLLSSPSANSESCALVIAGGVANFTDVKKTFRGLIRALDSQKKSLVQAGLKVFVRRGGPNEQAGLTEMSQFLRSTNLYGCVYGHETPLTAVITEVKAYLDKK